MFPTYNVFVIIPVIEDFLLLKFYRVKCWAKLKPWLLALSRLIEGKSVQQQVLPLSHLPFWNHTGQQRQMTN